MYDWDVNVITRNHSNMTVRMHGFDNSNDAANAAMAQTNSDRYLSCSYVGLTNKSPDTSNSEASHIHIPENYDYDYDVNYDFSNYRPTRKRGFGELLIDFCIAAWIPALILLFIHPILALGFLIVFGNWWFK